MFYSKNEVAWDSEVAEVFVDPACIIYWYLFIWKCILFNLNNKITKE